MNWDKRYGMNKDEFTKAWGSNLPLDDTFHSDGNKLKIGDRSYNLFHSHDIESGKSVGGIVHFPNGHAVSISWGPGTCSEQQTPFPRKAEIAHIDINGAFIKHPEFDGDEVGAYMSPNQVNRIIDRVKAL